MTALLNRTFSPRNISQPGHSFRIGYLFCKWSNMCLVLKTYNCFLIRHIELWLMFISFLTLSIFIHWQRITIADVLKDEWFKKDYKPPVFEDKLETSLDDVEAVFKDSEVRLFLRIKNNNSNHFVYTQWKSFCLCCSFNWSFLQQEFHVTEKTEERPAAMNAFELISMSKGLNLGNLFDVEQVRFW